jgi:prevent-host-death family protein
MVTTLSESKANLAELVERASHGEDVLITVGGQVKARLTRAEQPAAAVDREAWLRELRELRTLSSIHGENPLPIERILEQDRT